MDDQHRRCTYVNAAILLTQVFALVLQKSSRRGITRSSRRGSQFVIPRVKYEIGKQSIQYRGPTIWTFLNRLININESISKDKFKQILRRFSKNINNFSFRAPMIANKRNDYVYF